MSLDVFDMKLNYNFEDNVFCFVYKMKTYFINTYSADQAKKKYNQLPFRTSHIVIVLFL